LLEQPKKTSFYQSIKPEGKKEGGEQGAPPAVKDGIQGNITERQWIFDLAERPVRDCKGSDLTWFHRRVKMREG